MSLYLKPRATPFHIVECDKEPIANYEGDSALIFIKSGLAKLRYVFSSNWRRFDKP